MALLTNKINKVDLQGTADYTKKQNIIPVQSDNIILKVSTPIRYSIKKRPSSNGRAFFFILGVLRQATRLGARGSGIEPIGRKLFA